VGTAVHVLLFPVVTMTSPALRAFYLDALSHGTRETLLSLVVLAVSVAAAGGIVALRPVLRIGIAAVLAAGCLIGPFVYRDDTPPPPSTATGEPRPQLGNGIRKVLLISIDSLRADRLGCYGNSRSTSPAIDRVAAAGVRFDDAVSTAPWTLPSHMSMVTGRDVLSHGVVDEAEILIDAIPTLAGTLQAEGFSTVGIVSEGVLLGHWRGFGRGFDHYHDITELNRPAPRPEEHAPVATEFAIDYLRQNRDERLFMFLHYWDVHYDYNPPPPYDSMFDPDYRGSIEPTGFIDNEAIHAGMAERDLQHVISLYDGEIRWVDDHIARVIGTVEELGIFDETAIIITADHGDAFFEHGSKGHGLTLYRELMQIPLIIRAPGLPPGTVVKQPVSLTDLMPTILELTRVTPPARIDGISLLGLMTGAETSEGRAVYGVRCALAQPGCLFLQYSAVDSMIFGVWPFELELYAADDRMQRRNLIESTPNVRVQMNRLLRALDQQWGSFRADGGRILQGPLDETTEARLRELGYIP
jgi:hypothetical protein